MKVTKVIAFNFNFNKIPLLLKIEIATRLGAGVRIACRRNYCQQSCTNVNEGGDTSLNELRFAEVAESVWPSGSMWSFFLGFKLLFSIRNSLDKGFAASVIKQMPESELVLVLTSFVQKRPCHFKNE